MKIKINLDVLLIYVEVFLIIYLSGSWRQNDELEMIKWLMLVIGFFCAIRAFTLKYEWKIFLLLSGCCIVYLLLEFRMFSASINTFLFFLVKLLMFVFFVLFASKRNVSILEVIGNIVFVISVYSLFMYTILHIFHFNLPYIMSPGHGIEYEKYFLYITTELPSFQFNIGNFQIRRLMSFFWEPGVYQIYLCYALFFFLYCKAEKKTATIIVLIINIILTTSITGVCAAIIMLWYAVIKKMGINKKTIFFLAASVLIAVFGVVYLWQLKMQTSSYFTRLTDFIVGLRIFGQHWFFGTGFQNDAEYILVRGINKGNSNGLISWLTSMGLIGGILLLAPFLIRLHNITDTENKRLYILYFSLFILQNMAEPITNFPIMSLIVTVEYSYLLFNKEFKNSYAYW
ncbi:MAG: hypothetical protein NC419_02790 [Muribaculaceae bacterium]|nr:hypothetical protein [Muribaculaceae bacterium]